MTVVMASASVSMRLTFAINIDFFNLNSITVTAIANYTTRIAETSLSASQRQEALKFLGK